MAKKRDVIACMNRAIEAFDRAREDDALTNGEVSLLCTLLLADILGAADDEVGNGLYEAIDRVLRSQAEDAEALRRLFDICNVPTRGMTNRLRGTVVAQRPTEDR